MLRPLLHLWTVLLATIGVVSAEPQRTQDRLPPEVMTEMVRPAMDRIEEGDLRGAELAFDRLLAAAPPDQKGDLFTAFGVTLYTWAIYADDEGTARAALPYLERAIPALEQRFGADHPEVALALNSFADAAIALDPVDPPRSADAALERALNIRLQTLGLENAETLFNMIELARLKGLPSRTAGDPERISESASLFERAARAREVLPRDADVQSAFAIRSAAINMYLRNGRAADACATREAMRERRGGDDDFLADLVLIPDLNPDGRDRPGAEAGATEDFEAGCPREAAQ